MCSMHSDLIHPTYVTKQFPRIVFASGMNNFKFNLNSKNIRCQCRNASFESLLKLFNLVVLFAFFIKTYAGKTSKGSNVPLIQFECKRGML